MKKINFKILTFGSFIFSIAAFLIYDTFIRFSMIETSPRILGIPNTWAGYIFFGSIIIVALSIITYGLGYNNKFAKLGKYNVDFYMNNYLFKKKTKNNKEEIQNESTK